MQSFLRIRTSKFPILAGEEKEVVNPGTYGKAFAKYLQHELQVRGYSSPSICCEDWGWWVELRLPEKTTGIACYRHHDKNTECDFVCTPDLADGPVWSWRRLRRINMHERLDGLLMDLQSIFEDDSEIQFLGLSEEFPF